MEFKSHPEIKTISASVISIINSNDRILGILNYVKQNKIDKFIVLDDETDFERVLKLVPKEFKNSWIEIDFSEGLTNKISLYAFKFLNDLI